MVKRRGAGGDDGPDYTIDAVDTAFKLLRLIARGERPSSLIDLTAAAEISRSTAFRMLWNLERVGMVRHEVDGGYLLGAAALDFGSAYGRQNPVVQLARTYVDGLRDRTNETCALLVRDGAERVCLHCADSQQEVRFTMRLGTAGPLWRGAAGRVLFAFLPKAERLAMVARQGDRAALEKDALAVLKAGFRHVGPGHRSGCLVGGVASARSRRRGRRIGLCWPDTTPNPRKCRALQSADTVGRQ